MAGMVWTIESGGPKAGVGYAWGGIKYEESSSKGGGAI